MGSSTCISVSIPAPGISLCVFFSLRYGKIVSTKAILDKTTNKCKGEKTAVLGDGEQLRVSPTLCLPFTAASPHTQGQREVSKVFRLKR